MPQNKVVKIFVCFANINVSTKSIFGFHFFAFLFASKQLKSFLPSTTTTTTVTTK